MLLQFNFFKEPHSVIAITESSTDNGGLFSRVVLLRIQYAGESPQQPVKMQTMTLHLGQIPKFSFLSQLPGIANVADQAIIL